MGDPSSQNQNGTSNGDARAAPSNSSSSTSVTDHLSQALRDLARGETAAAALEANLTNLENKLDELLASFGVEAGDDEDSGPSSEKGSRQDKGKGATTNGDEDKKREG